MGEYYKNLAPKVILKPFNMMETFMFMVAVAGHGWCRIGSLR